MTAIDRISIELTNRCTKACWFCYNHSSQRGATLWKPYEIIAFVKDCAAHGLKAVSFGGGEPLQYAPVFDVLSELRGLLFRSLTTNGQLLKGKNLNRLVDAQPNKVHVSLHFPEDDAEVERVIRQTKELAERGIRSGINFLVARSKLAAAQQSAARVRESGIANDRIVYLPMRGDDTPTPGEIALVSGNLPFQSVHCLSACKASPRFCSISWDKQVGWCSYTTTRNRLENLTYQGLMSAIDCLGLAYCGGVRGS